MKKNTTALIVDDEADIRELIEMAFMGIGIHCILSPTVTDAIRQLKKEDIDFIVTDMRLPDGDGLNLVAHIQKNYPQLPVCVITAHGNMELAVKALKLGAFDFVNKPFDLKQLRSMAQAAMKLMEDDENQDVGVATAPAKKGTPSASQNKAVNIIGDSPVMKKLDAIIKKLARSQAPVFIHGESGTGKELVARSIHAQSARKDGPFVPVNCGAIPENLVESEFFGYKKGSFTGANKDTKGLFASANGGTLFLDEVADLPLAMQVKLLRAIQERAIRPIGGDTEIPIDIRILSATHKNLPELVKNHEFREDLYYRLNVISLGMPPLRKRTGDVEILTRFIINQLAERENAEQFTLTDGAINKLNSYDFPGNVRELENVLERATTFCDDHTITENDIHFSTKTNDNDVDDMMSFDLSDGLDDELDNDNVTDNVYSTPDSLANVLDKAEKKAILSKLKESDNEKSLVAEKLGISLATLHRKLKKHDIE
ncbi:MAG: sigma-54-dependent Fis family transcriptional regulator [Cardiobacteriales bacterium]|nr:MAG: sigma-54-dependent Fis family transcriptional regulator [Cardiobacteriales bacterium]